MDGEKPNKITPSISLLGIAKELEKTMQCNCDLDNWGPQPDTNHSHSCRIHTFAHRKWNVIQNRMDSRRKFDERTK